MADYTLHCFLESGNAYKAALMLQLTGADWEPQWVDFFKGATRSPEFRDLNVQGEVPVLVDHTAGDKPLTQSGAILKYLSDKTGQFGANSADEEYDILRWLLWDNHKLTANIATFRFLSHFMKKEGDDVEFLKGRGMSALKVLNIHLSDREWIALDRPTIVDLSCCGYLFWPEQFGVDWKNFPAIGAWLERIKSLENWASPEALLPATPAAA